MLRGSFENAGELESDELRAAYERRLAAAVESVGLPAAAERTGIDEERLSALLAGESPELTLEEAATVLALDDDLPDAGSIAAEARDLLLMGMSVAVLDVEAVAAGIDDAMEPKEIQQKAEGRFPMTLGEYALVHSYVESRKR